MCGAWVHPTRCYTCMHACGWVHPHRGRCGVTARVMYVMCSGAMVMFGEASGAPEPLDLTLLTGLGSVRRVFCNQYLLRVAGFATGISALTTQRPHCMVIQVTVSYPTGSHFDLTERQFQARASTVLGWVRDGRLRMEWTVLPLARAADAHRLLVGRHTTGKLLLATMVIAGARI